MIFLGLVRMKIAGIAIYLSSLFPQILVKGNKLGRISNSMGKTSYMFPKSFRLLHLNNLYFCLSEFPLRQFLLSYLPLQLPCCHYEIGGTFFYP